MKRGLGLILILLCMVGCTATPALKPMASPVPALGDDREEDALGEDVTDSVMATADRFEAYVTGTWTASDTTLRLEVEEDHFVLYADGPAGQESGTPPGDLPVNVMEGADQDGNPVRITVGACYENAMIVSIGDTGRVLFFRDVGEQ